MEYNIGELQTMLQKEQYPKSLQVNIKVNVASAQQSAMDTALSNAKEQFQKTILGALITARQDELLQKKQDVYNSSQSVADIFQNGFRRLRDNNIPILEQDDDEITTTIQLCVNTYKDKVESADQTIQTKFFFTKEKELHKAQQINARKQEQLMNQELNDPQIEKLSKQVNVLQKIVTKNIIQSKTGSKEGLLNKNPKEKQKSVKKDRTEKRTDPKAKRVQRQPQRMPLNPKTSYSKSTVQNKKSRGHVKENRKPQHLYTNTTTRSAILAQSSRKKRN